jgi:hypothetical protein
VPLPKFPIPCICPDKTLDLLKNLAMHQKTILFLLLTAFFFTANAQMVADLTENTPYVNNGLEYGFYISNERSKEVKGEDYERYEVMLYINNNSSCVKIIPMRNNVQGVNGNETLLAEFMVKNATGKRLTAKSGRLNARPWFTQVRLSDGTRVQAQAGYILRIGESITAKIIVIVPKGERPSVNCRMVNVLD